MSTKTLIVLACGLALVGLIPAGGAQLAEAGLSGQCYNANNTEGGEDEARANTDGDVVALPGTADDPAGQADGYGGAVPALAEFATESVNDGGQTGNACKRYDCFTEAQCSGRAMRYDYLEAHAKVGDAFLQACYNGGATVAGTCPTSPTGVGG